MKDSTVSGIILISIAVIIGSAIGGFYLGKHQGFAKGYDKGKQIGYSQGYDAAPIATLDQLNAEQGLVDMTNKYNVLVDDYNSLRNAVIKYVGATGYQARTPITCNTTNYGINDQFATTNCY